mmetsp:Transcript_42091/g.78765  ORF Transcript_42091/g.78765 Transcript_42091/m.78765 type:complete len:303 (+) Transcript_42091:1181-2089(+)
MGRRRESTSRAPGAAPSPLGRPAPPWSIGSPPRPRLGTPGSPRTDPGTSCTCSLPPNQRIPPARRPTRAAPSASQAPRRSAWGSASGSCAPSRARRRTCPGSWWRSQERCTSRRGPARRARSQRWGPRCGRAAPPRAPPGRRRARGPGWPPPQRCTPRRAPQHCRWRKRPAPPPGKPRRSPGRSRTRAGRARPALYPRFRGGPGRRSLWRCTSCRPPRRSSRPAGGSRPPPWSIRAAEWWRSGPDSLPAPCSTQSCTTDPLRAPALAPARARSPRTRPSLPCWWAGRSGPERCPGCRTAPPP